MRAPLWIVAVVALVWAAPHTAAAQFWRPDVPPSPREQVIQQADMHLAAARRAGSGISAAERARRAIGLYEEALRLDASAELHYRAYSAAAHYLAATEGYRELGWRKIVEHIDGLRAADPLDPRGFDLGPAISHATARLAAPAHPEAEALYLRGIREYELWLKRLDETDVQWMPELGTTHSNVAELLMAVGRLGEAIEHYRQATELPGRLPELAWYGLAVAYDRDGQAANARRAMLEALHRDRDLGTLEAADRFGSQADAGDIYFVPQGDRYYYLALAHHVAGREAPARVYFQRYLAEVKGARKEYLARAREHLARLSSRPAGPATSPPARKGQRRDR